MERVLQCETVYKQLSNVMFSKTVPLIRKDALTCMMVSFQHMQWISRLLHLI